MDFTGEWVEALNLHIPYLWYHGDKPQKDELILTSRKECQTGESLQSVDLEYWASAQGDCICSAH